MSRPPTAEVESFTGSTIEVGARIEAAAAIASSTSAAFGAAAPATPDTVVPSHGVPAVRLGDMRRLILALAVLAAVAVPLSACDHITIGPVQPSCDICGGHGPR